VPFSAGVSRSIITPYWGVELTGWGYYIERRWRRIRDDLKASALVLDDGSRTAALVALDMMVIDRQFTDQTRRLIHQHTGIPPEAILLTCSHSHNAPAAGGLLGAGECDPVYADWASRQAATAAIVAWHKREPVRASIVHGEVAGLTYNRTREAGPVDTRLTTLRLDRTDGRPLAMVVNFQAHPCVHTILRPFDVTRDVPGEVCDHIEAALPGVTAMYVQGACGDVNFLPEFSTPQRCHEPARRVADMAVGLQSAARAIVDPVVAHAVQPARIPTRRWLPEEIETDRAEAQRRLASGDISGWQEAIGRAMTNRPLDMVARHGGDEHKAVRAMARFHIEWTERMLVDYQARPEWLETEVQAVRLGELCIVANSSELFTTLALDVRQRSPAEELMIACYANGRIGYLPDEHDIERRTYAAYQSPKYCNQFPFVAESGPAMCAAMLEVLRRCRET
jgi:hypothetical protein